MRPLQIRCREPGEPFVSLLTPDWRAGLDAVERMGEPERSHYRAMFAHLDLGWRAVRTLQHAAEALSAAGPDREGDVAHWVDVEVTDKYRDLAQRCLALVPSLADGGDFDALCADLLPEAEAIARNVRLLAMMERSPVFPDVFRGIIAPAVAVMNDWERRLEGISEPVLEYASPDD